MRILLLALAVLLAGCSLQPVYSGGQKGEAAGFLGAVEVSPIPDRAGFLVRDRLLQRLPGAESPRYRLDVVLDDLPAGALVSDAIYIPLETPLLAAARQLAVEPFKGVTRTVPAPTPEATKAIFALPRPQAGKASAGSVVLPDGSWMVFRVDAARPANPAEVPAAQLATMRQQLSSAAAEQTVKSYLAELRKQRKIRVVEAQL